MTDKLRAKYDTMRAVSEIGTDETAKLTFDIATDIVMDYMHEAAELMNGKTLLEVPFVLAAIKILADQVEATMVKDRRMAGGLAVALVTYDLMKDDVRSIAITGEPDKDGNFVNTDIAEELLRKIFEGRGE